MTPRMLDRQDFDPTTLAIVPAPLLFSWSLAEASNQSHAWNHEEINLMYYNSQHPELGGGAGDIAVRFARCASVRPPALSLGSLVSPGAANFWSLGRDIPALCPADHLVTRHERAVVTKTGLRFNFLVCLRLDY